MNNCKTCAYYNYYEDGSLVSWCSKHFKELLTFKPCQDYVSNGGEKLILALLKMTKQYLTLDPDYGVLTHEFMGAGETTMDVLEELGYVEAFDGNPVYYTFTEKAKEVLENE